MSPWRVMDGSAEGIILGEGVRLLKKTGISKPAKITRHLRNLILQGVSWLQHAYAFCSHLFFF
jgi:hypothetical protein